MAAINAMKHLIAFALFTLCFTSQAFDTKTYLFQVLEDPHYLKRWSQIFENEDSVDDWLIGYTNEYDGVSSPGKEEIIDGSTYEIHNVCKPHSCGDNYFVVAFPKDGSSAVGILFDGLKVTKYFGFNLQESAHLEKVKEHLGNRRIQHYPTN